MPKSDTEVATIERGSSDIVVYGHLHTAEEVQPHLDEIEEYMQETDHFVWELPGLENSYTTGETTIEEARAKTGYKEYFDEIEALATDNYDEIWGPDPGAGPIGNTARATTHAGPLAITGYGIYYMTQPFREIIEEHRDLEITIPDQLKKINPRQISENRRNFLKKGIASLAGAVYLPSLLYGTSLQEKASKELTGEVKRDDKYPLNWIDNRDVFNAEGIDQVATNHQDDDIFCMWGSAHTNSIEHYLENPEKRQSKLDLYKHIRDNTEEEMAHWKYTDNTWILEDTIDLI